MIIWFSFLYTNILDHSDAKTVQCSRVNFLTKLCFPVLCALIYEKDRVWFMASRSAHYTVRKTIKEKKYKLMMSKVKRNHHDDPLKVERHKSPHTFQFTNLFCIIVWERGAVIYKIQWPRLKMSSYFFNLSSELLYLNCRFSR